MRKYLNIAALIGLVVVLYGCGKTEEKEKTSEDRIIENTTNQANKIQEAAVPVAKVTFIELGSVKCIPCKAMQPIMKEIEEEYQDEVKVVFHDVWTDEGRPYSRKYKIRVIPTQVFLDKNGNEYFRHEGFFPKEEVVKILKMEGVQ